MKFTKVDKCFYVVLLATVIDMLGFSLTIPILANYAVGVQMKENRPVECGYDDVPVNMTRVSFLINTPNCTTLMNDYKANTGLLTSSYALAGAVSSMWMPIFSDKFGRKKAVMLSIFGSLTGFVLQALADYSVFQSFGFLMFARIWGRNHIV